jgi:hypothetical protein
MIFDQAEVRTGEEVLRLVAHELKNIERELRALGATLSEGNPTDQFIAKALAGHRGRIRALTKVCRIEADRKSRRSLQGASLFGGRKPSLKLVNREGYWHACGTYRDGNQKLRVRKSLGLAVAKVPRAKALRFLEEFIAEALRNPEPSHQ